MNSKYFDEWEFLQAIGLMESAPFKAKEKLEEYIDKYPKDYSAYSYYASILITLNKFDEAEKIIQEAEMLIRQDNYFLNHFEKVEYTIQDIFFDKLRLLAYQGKYKELYDVYFNTTYKLKSNRSLERILFFCKKQMGEIKKNRESGSSYTYRQILEYSEEDFWNHINKHLADGNSTMDNPNKNIFVPDFPIKDVVNEIRKNIPSNNKLCPGFIDDAYFFKYNECGRVDNRLVNYIKVICFHNTSNIITILPVEQGENFPYVDLNYMIEKIPVKEIKRKSAIERFNKRFKR